MPQYSLPSNSGCCACGSADYFDACNNVLIDQYGTTITAPTYCNGAPIKIVSNKLPCSKIASSSICPQWHDFEVVSVTGNLTITYEKSGSTSCGEPFLITEFQSSSIGFTLEALTFSGLYTVTSSGGTSSNPDNVEVSLGSFHFCCEDKTKKCKGTKFSIYKFLPAQTVLGGSVFGECLSIRGYPNCTINEIPGLIYFYPDIYANFTVEFQNMSGEKMGIKSVYPEIITTCPFDSTTPECNNIGSYFYTLYGSAIIRGGNE